MDKFLKFVAGIFECEVGSLSMNTKYEDFEKWDSLMMVRLVMELEEEYKINIPIEEVGNIKTLADLYQFIK